MQPSDLLNQTRWERWKALSQNPDQMAKLFQAMIVDDQLFDNILTKPTQSPGEFRFISLNAKP